MTETVLRMGALRLINPAFCTTDQLYKSHLAILCQAEIDEIEKIDGNKGADPEKIETFLITQLRSPINDLNSPHLAKRHRC